MHVREATAEDAPSVREVADAAWHDAHDAIVGPDAVEAFLADYYAVDELRERYRDGDSSTVVACEDGDVVGYASGVDGEGTYTLGSIYVRPSWQGEGVGSRLLAEIEAMARERDYDRLRLVVMADNDDARRFYEARGFEHVADDYDERLDVENCEYAKPLGEN